ncbi:MAG: GNAT family N-acetyltransferase [Kiritimatiellia bacterium]
MLILYNKTRESAAAGVTLESDAGVLAEVSAVSAALGKNSVPFKTAAISCLRELPRVLSTFGDEVVFNLVEGLDGAVGDVNAVPVVCEAFGRGCTGNTSECLQQSLDKWLTKYLLKERGLPVPDAWIVPVGQKFSGQPDHKKPLLLKPLLSDASEGITQASVVPHPYADIDTRIKELHSRFSQPVLVETFVDGRELNVSVIDMGSGPQVMPIAEIDFSAFPADRHKIVDYEAKWIENSFAYNNTPRKIPADLPEKTARHIRELALGTWHALNCRDYIRVDFRLDAKLNPFILEINANPDISPDAGLAAAIAAAGISYDKFVMQMISNASGRRTETKPSTVPPAPSKIAGGVEIRRTVPADVEPLMKILAGTAFFHDNELQIGEEVLLDAVNELKMSDYQSYTACVNGKPAGWVCWGATPCTDKTFDVYWLAVDKKIQGKGIGKKLMAFTEESIWEAGGRLAVLETAGREDYEPTRNFYIAIGYTEAARVKDFYAPGDDKVIYTKPSPR